jgi:predicted enzyme related to lactoylglutathione lyase
MEHRISQGASSSCGGSPSHRRDNPQSRRSKATASLRSVGRMITNISIVSVFVKDVDASKQFYIDVLGFEAKDDITLGDGYRWCTVVHPNQPELMVSLAIPGPPHSPELVEAMKRAQDEGGMHGLGLNVDDCQKTYEDLCAKGVEFIQPPSQRPYGTEALCRDNSGNWLVLVQPTTEPFSAEDFK